MPIAISRLIKIGLLLLLTNLQPVLADTKADCLSASGNSAVSLCQAAIQQGETDAAVYIKLGNTLNGQGKYPQAISAYQSGLQKHPNNSQLNRRLKIAKSNLAEQSFLQENRQAEKNSAAKNSAQLKIQRIRCLKSSSKTALQACRKVLDNDPGDQEIQARKRELVALLESPPPAPKQPEPRQLVETPKPEKIAPPSPADDARVAQQKQEKRQQQAQVKNIQSTLNAIGFEVGTPDGVAGRKTQKAVSDFLRLSGYPASQNSLDENLLEKLQSAKNNFAQAEAQYRQAIQLEQDGKLQQALTAAKNASSLAPWYADAKALSTRIDHAVTTQTEQAEKQQAIDQQIAATEQALAAGDIASSEERLEKLRDLTPDKALVSSLNDKIQAAKKEEQEKARLATADSARLIEEKLQHYKRIKQRNETRQQQLLESAQTVLSESFSVSTN